MQISLNKQPRLHLSAKHRELITDMAIYLFVILFMYTAASKLLTIKPFASTLAKSPLIGSYSLIVAWTIPIVEMLISFLLIIPQIKKWGLYAALFLMSVFTLYLMYMVFSGTELPCHCGGVISKMTWQQHIWFNLAFVALAITGLATNRK
ncbi:MauE/DoxX family redox-associated membrane protein [Pedobacter heparinus]|uniref:MauE/DoxX family redox-associated membrane protein n=1 Tax=Pedobacter heparinus TaxID=984 RepID=UPI00292EDEFE|nr:MauE/DoxX family redox-associated membrane protein [Pedobacter heparinus]